MWSHYHIQITKDCLTAFFSSTSLREIVKANVGQDSLSSLFGIEPYRHVCNCTLLESLAYIEHEHASIAELAQSPGQEAKQRTALGRLLHTVQDLYAHTNYVALWLAERVRTGDTSHALIDGLDVEILASPALQVAQWLAWREPLYYLPIVGPLLRRFWLPAESHEAIHLDCPQRGEFFDLAMTSARQRTLVEYARAVATIREVGGQEAATRFHGRLDYATNASPAHA